MLAITNLHKSFGATRAVDGVSFGVERGQLVGLLGPNGAGKTTTVSMIAGLVTPDQGAVTIGGAVVSSDGDPVKRRLGLVPQDLALYDELTARANLRLFGALYGLSGAGARSGDRLVADTRGSRGSRQRSRQDVQRRHEAPSQSRRRVFCTIPTSCCWTSRPSASIRRAATRSSTISSSSSRAARRCSTRRITWKRPSVSPTAS